jgi:hypothetical protein
MKKFMVRRTPLPPFKPIVAWRGPAVRAAAPGPVPVARQPLDAGEQVRVGAAAVEQREFVATAQRRLDDVAAQEGGAAEHEKLPTSLHRILPSVIGPIGSSRWVMFVQPLRFFVAKSAEPKARRLLGRELIHPIRVVFIKRASTMRSRWFANMIISAVSSGSSSATCRCNCGFL